MSDVAHLHAAVVGCGAIAYEAQVEPGTIGICHCSDCQKLTGSAFRANVQAPAGSFRFSRWPSPPGCGTWRTSI